MITHPKRLMALLMAFGLVAAACGSSDDTETTEAAAEDEIAGVDLSGVCPATIAFQLDWNPESEHGAMYEMVGKEGYTLDSNSFVVSGDLVSQGEDTGVDIEVRSGGPAVGFQSPLSVMYQDESVTFAYATTDDAYNSYDQFPSVSVVAPLEINPQIIMWDPATYPDVKTIADLPDDTIVRYFNGGAYMDYLVASGQVLESQLDSSYDGTPAVFIAEGGKIAQQGFATSEPFAYKNEITEWGKDVAYELINDTGYRVYAASIALRAADLADMTPCLEKLVPVIQQAQVDYANSPDASNALIVEAVEANDNGWIYSADIAAFSIEAQLAEGLVGNGPDSTLGNFDDARLAEVFEILSTTVYPDAAPVTPADLYTNDFIDESIGL